MPYCVRQVVWKRIAWKWPSNVVVSFVFALILVVVKILSIRKLTYILELVLYTNKRTHAYTHSLLWHYFMIFWQHGKYIHTCYVSKQQHSSLVYVAPSIHINKTTYYIILEIRQHIDMKKQRTFKTKSSC